MANKKLKYFEYANTSGNTPSKQSGAVEMEFLETINGSVFILTQSHQQDGKSRETSKLAIERITYYLQNEFVEKPGEAVYNALIYTNGFIYEYARKNPDIEHLHLSCACVMIRNNEVFYGVVGDMLVYFFNGKKVSLIAQGMADNEGENNKNNQKTNTLLGQLRNIEPLVNQQPLVPLNDDMILMGTRDLFLNVTEKQMQRVLSDPMPVQTKALRLADMGRSISPLANISLQIISFYSLPHTIRKFEPVPVGSGFKLKKSLKKPEKNDSSGEEKKEKGMVGKQLKNPLVRVAIIVLTVLLLGYMFYDLFLFDPRPARNIELQTSVTNDKDTTITEDEHVQVEQELETPNERAQEEDKFTLPNDTAYLVRSGDTWSAIYSRFRVCSWFIKNHPDNSGKFDKDENPVAGSRITIPLLYSSDSELNPDFHQEFSLEETGNRCQNANESFLDDFYGKYPELLNQ